MQIRQTQNSFLDPKSHQDFLETGPGPLAPSVYTNPDIFESATFSFRIQYFNDHTYPYSNQICPSTRIRGVSGFTLVPRTPLGILATEHALYSARNFNPALLTRPSTGKRENLGTNTVFTVKNWARSCYVTG